MQFKTDTDVLDFWDSILSIIAMSGFSLKSELFISCTNAPHQNKTVTIAKGREKLPAKHVQ